MAGVGIDIPGSVACFGCRDITSLASSGILLTPDSITHEILQAKSDANISSISLLPMMAFKLAHPLSSTPFTMILNQAKPHYVLDNKVLINQPCELMKQYFNYYGSLLPYSNIRNW